MLRWFAAACFISRLRLGFGFSSLVVVARAGHLRMLTLTYVLDRMFETRGPSVLPNKNIIFFIYQEPPLPLLLPWISPPCLGLSTTTSSWSVVGSGLFPLVVRFVQKQVMSHHVFG